jgi:hypothetical protein
MWKKLIYFYIFFNKKNKTENIRCVTVIKNLVP